MEVNVKIYKGIEALNKVKEFVEYKLDRTLKDNEIIEIQDGNIGVFYISHSGGVKTHNVVKKSLGDFEEFEK